MNMSYCRFQNTLNDLRDCEEALQNEEKLSLAEIKAAKHLIGLCMEIADNYNNMEFELDEEDDA
jgi:hypothetical protein